jgi:hypothetical protein
VLRHGIRRFALIFPPETADEVGRALERELPKRGWKETLVRSDFPYLEGWREYSRIPAPSGKEPGRRIMFSGVIRESGLNVLYHEVQPGECYIISESRPSWLEKQIDYVKGRLGL